MRQRTFVYYCALWFLDIYFWYSDCVSLDYLYYNDYLVYIYIYINVREYRRGNKKKTDNPEKPAA